MKIGIIGLGYWGNIILKNLESLGYSNFVLCDNSQSNIKTSKNYLIVKDYKQLECDCVFIITQSSYHFEICKYFLEKKIKIFCEKPLTTSASQAKILYELAEKNDTILFTDWIYTFNSHIEKIRNDYKKGKFGEIKSLMMNRLNFGPERFDVNARWDLASHDISILQYIFSEKPNSIKWNDYKTKNKSIQEDSSLGVIVYDEFHAIVNASWNYRKKVRECVFEFEKCLVIWDEHKEVLLYEDSKNLEILSYTNYYNYNQNEYISPLINSIQRFFTFNKKDMEKQKKLSLEILKILEADK